MHAASQSLCVDLLQYSLVRTLGQVLQRHRKKPGCRVRVLVSVLTYMHIRLKVSTFQKKPGSEVWVTPGFYQ